MLIREGSKLLHWNYFLALESDLDRLSRYVEFAEDNYTTYSLEMALLLLAAGSEADVVLKGLCKKVHSRKKAENIEQYRKILAPKFPKLCNMKIRIPRYGLEIIPWDNWQKNETPDWWKAYNKVKHERDKYFRLAKLQYTVAAITGLYAATIYLYQEEAENGSLVPLPKLLTPPEDWRVALKQSDFGVSLIYRF